MNDVNDNICHTRPVTCLVSTGMIVVFLLYRTNTIDTLPCHNGLNTALARHFTHIAPEHLLSNLIVFGSLSRIEEIIGSIAYIKLLVQLALWSAGLEASIKYQFKIPCAIGFSSILFGLLVWALFRIVRYRMSVALMLLVLALVVMPSLSNPQASMLGHALGALSGLIVAAYYRPCNINDDDGNNCNDCYYD